MSILNKIKYQIAGFFILTLFVFYSSSLDIFVKNVFLDFKNDNYSNVIEGFFKNITRLGDSSWYFGLFLFFLVILTINKKIKLVNLNYIDKKVNFFVSCIIYLLATGIITQILKHLIGRHRPNYTVIEEGFNFSFFTTNSNFHSYPSGHSSTIFILCLIFSTVFPKLKYYFLVFGFIIAISRVFVGAHFFTDVVAGGLLALIIFNILNIFLKRNYEKYLFSKIHFKDDSQLYHSIIILLGLALLVTVGPTLDVYISGLFYYGSSQFFLQSFDTLSLLFREILLPILLIYILVVPLVGKYLRFEIVFFGYKFSYKEIILIWISQAISVGIIINLILKNFWGRARPEDVLIFNGNKAFTPWYQISKGCETNCSFVSGDASVGFAIIILYFITKNNFYLYSSLVFGSSLGIIRIMAGGHFFSDVVFSGIIVISINLLIYKVFNKKYG